MSNKPRHISATTTVNNVTGAKRYFLDGKRVSYESAAFAAIACDRKSCFTTDTRRNVTRNHSLLTFNRAGDA